MQGVGLDCRALVEAALSEDEATAEEASRALFRDVVEPMADAFDEGKCLEYARFFGDVMAQVVPGWRGADLDARYARVRRPRRYHGGGQDVSNVVVLSRVTLGADVAVTSVLLDAAKKRFPVARIHFAGPRKNYELFAADPRVGHLEVSYSRMGVLRGRIQAGVRLGDHLRRLGGIVIDPDSRLTQLGLAPVCNERDYYFWESRSYGANGAEPLGALAQRWAAETFGVQDARSYIAPAMEAADERVPLVTVSFGVGENPTKRVADPFEQEIVWRLAARGLPVLVDEGAGGEEGRRARDAVAGCDSDRVRTFYGPFAAFAVAIARSYLYVGYDSAGQHVAATAGVPLVAVFSGFTNERMLSRWRPWGSGRIEVVRADEGDVLERSLAAAGRLLD